MKKKWLVVTLIVIMVFGITGCGSQEAGDSDQPPVNNEKVALEIGAAPGPVTYPLSYMVENPDDIELKLEPWKKYDQLLAMITSQQVSMSSTPLTNAFTLYNNGVDVQLINVSLWGMLYVLSCDDTIQSITDLKGQVISISAGQGSNHDLITRHLLLQNGLDPEKDVEITYLDFPEATSKLATGELKYAVMNEPNSSMALLNARKGGVELKRVLDLQKEWQNITGQEEARIPQAGFVVVNGSQVDKAVVEKFQNNYMAAAEWINNNPKEAGALVEKYFDWMKAPAVQGSLEFARLHPVPAAECKEEIEAFYNELSKTSPAEALGGKLPDAEFYFQP